MWRIPTLRAAASADHPPLFVHMNDDYIFTKTIRPQELIQMSPFLIHKIHHLNAKFIILNNTDLAAGAVWQELLRDAVSFHAQMQKSEDSSVENQDSSMENQDSSIEKQGFSIDNQDSSVENQRRSIENHDFLC